MSADEQTSGERWLDMTNAAYNKVTGFLHQVAEPERQAMWVEVTGTSANQWTCSISLRPLDAAAPYDAIVRHRDLAIVIPERDFDKVRGAPIAGLGVLGLSTRRPLVPNGSSSQSIVAPRTLSKSHSGITIARSRWRTMASWGAAASSGLSEMLQVHWLAEEPVTSIHIAWRSGSATWSRKPVTLS